MNDIPYGVIYCRVSGFRQIEGSSLRTQEQVCTDFVEKLEHRVVEKFIEKGESAKTADRTELQRMMRYCTNKKNKVSLVVFYKVDRLARHKYDYEMLCHVLRSKGIQVQSATEPITNSPAGRFMEGMLSAQSQFDNEVRAERSTDGMKDAVKSGRYIWIAPMGYKNTRIAGKANIVQTALSPIILETFERVAQGIEPTDHIRREMYHRGLMNAKGKPIAKAYFYRLLKNPLYAGYITAFKGRQKGTFEPIVSEELFNQVQNVLKYKGKRTMQYKWDHEDFPLRRFVSHPEGNKLRGSWSKGKMGKLYAFYRFERIPGANYRKDMVEEIFINFFNQYSLSSDNARTFIQCIRQEYGQATKEKKKTEEQLKKRLKEIQDRENLLIEKNLNGIIPDDVVQKQLRLLKNEEVDIRAELYADVTANVNVKSVLNFAEKFLENPGLFWKQADLKTKLELQEFAFPKGITFDGKNMRTPEVAIFFKNKGGFLPSKSPVVQNSIQNANSLMVQFNYLYKILN